MSDPQKTKKVRMRLCYAVTLEFPEEMPNDEIREWMCGKPDCASDHLLYLMKLRRKESCLCPRFSVIIEGEEAK